MKALSQYWLATLVAFTVGVCARPALAQAPDTPLGPPAAFALGVLQASESAPGSIPNPAALASQFAQIGKLIEAKAAPAQLGVQTAKLERALGPSLVSTIKARKYSQADLFAFMLASGVRPPAGGTAGLNPDLIVIRRAAAVLSGGAAPTSRFEVKAVPPEEALSPLETLVLGAVTLLRQDFASFEMPQIFRLALYLRPIRRIHDPKIKNKDPRLETVYLDRIWRVLKPEQIAKIRTLELTRSDLGRYLERHEPMYQVDPKAQPTFALLEYAVNDFHEKIAPQETVDRSHMTYYIAPTILKQKDGKVLFEGICAPCHGMQGQGRFPPVAVPSYLALHSDNEHFHIIKSGPPQKKGSPIVMPAFGAHGLSDPQIWAVARYLRSFEEKKFTRNGEAQAKKLGVRFYDAKEAYALWKKKDPNVLFLDVQSEIAYRIMGHIGGARHVPPEEVGNRLGELPKDKEILVIDMFGSQGIAVATSLAKSGFKTSYLSPGMVEWHIGQNYPVAYGND